MTLHSSTTKLKEENTKELKKKLKKCKGFEMVKGVIPYFITGIKEYLSNNSKHK